MKTHYLVVLACAALAVADRNLAAAEPPKTPPDLTKDLSAVDRKATYNLGATGMRGWIYTRPANYIDSLQGRTTAASRQILVTHVGAKSPADGVVQVDDVIVGVGGKPFSDDARKSIAFAIQNAEKESEGGKLQLSLVRKGEAMEVTITLPVMGTYSATAPYECAKSKRIFEAACKALEKEPVTESWNGAVTGLALLATGNKEYLPKVQELARKMAPATLDLSKNNKGSAWENGYRTIFLSEYFLITGDKEVLHGIREYTMSLARGQSMYGTFGHGYSALKSDGSLHGSIPPYGPVNMAGLAANLGIVLGKKCGVDDPEVDAAITRAAGFFSYYTDKGAIPYGEHAPWPYHENNGKNSMTAVMFAAMGKHTADAKFFAQMATAGYSNRECGHTGQGFSYLWSALGANVGGPAAISAFFKEASWHLDLVRRCDGSFTYDGGEQYGAGKTDDDTYYGKSGYNGLSPTATYVLTYSLPWRRLVITGRGLDNKAWLKKDEAAACITAGRFDLDRQKMSAPDLVKAFGSWSPIVRSWAAQELATRPEAKDMTAQLIAMAEGKNGKSGKEAKTVNDPHLIQSACETLGLLKTADALPVLVKQVSSPDRWVRLKAAQAINAMGPAAKPVFPDLLKALVDTAEPLSPIKWADPVQLAHGELGRAVFGAPMRETIKTADPKLLYPAVRSVSLNADGAARGVLRDYFEHRVTADDVVALGPDIIVALKNPCPADTMFGNEIRMGAFKALTKYRFQEGIEAGVYFAKTQGGHGSEKRTAEIMKEIVAYGSAAQSAIPGLEELIVSFNEQVQRREFPGGAINQQRVSAVEDAIKAIKAATTSPEMKHIKAP